MRLRLLTRRTAGLSFLGTLALWGVIATGLLLTGTYGRVEADERPSIAVLPLVDWSGLEEGAYFTDGIHDEILTQLYKISALRHVLPPSEMAEIEVVSLNHIRGELGARDWDVFDSDGRFLGVVTLPRLFSHKLFRSDKIYGIWRDEFEVQYMVRLRILGDFAAGVT